MSKIKDIYKTIVRLNDLDKRNLIKLISLAGFIVIENKRAISLMDIKEKDADKYSDLTFVDLIDAVKALQPYLKNEFTFI